LFIIDNTIAILYRMLSIGKHIYYISDGIYHVNILESMEKKKLCNGYYFQQLGCGYFLNYQYNHNCRNMSLVNITTMKCFCIPKFISEIVFNYDGIDYLIMYTMLGICLFDIKNSNPKYNYWIDIYFFGSTIDKLIVYSNDDKIGLLDKNAFVRYMNLELSYDSLIQNIIVTPFSRKKDEYVAFYDKMLLFCKVEMHYNYYMYDYYNCVQHLIRIKKPIRWPQHIISGCNSEYVYIYRNDLLLIYTIPTFKEFRFQFKQRIFHCNPELNIFIDIDRNCYQFMGHKIVKYKPDFVRSYNMMSTKTQTIFDIILDLFPVEITSLIYAEYYNINTTKKWKNYWFNF